MSKNDFNKIRDGVRSLWFELDEDQSFFYEGLLDDLTSPIFGRAAISSNGCIETLAHFGICDYKTAHQKQEIDMPSPLILPLMNYLVVYNINVINCSIQTPNEPFLEWKLIPNDQYLNKFSFDFIIICLFYFCTN